jgi:hypothetical protein
MKRRALAPCLLLTLSGCSLLFPEDPREGGEGAEDCSARVTGLLGPTTSYRQYVGEIGVPTYTYDITKMAFGDMQALMTPQSDDTAGARAMQATNETSTAVALFMDSDVDEHGAFFTGRQPALYRVRGERQPVADMIASGCARQQEGMRLIMIDVANEIIVAEPPAGESEQENETE